MSTKVTIFSVTGPKPEKDNLKSVTGVPYFSLRDFITKRIKTSVTTKGEKPNEKIQSSSL